MMDEYIVVFYAGEAQLATVPVEAEEEAFAYAKVMGKASNENIIAELPNGALVFIFKPRLTHVKVMKKEDFKREKAIEYLAKNVGEAKGAN